MNERADDTDMIVRADTSHVAVYDQERYGERVEQRKRELAFIKWPSIESLKSVAHHNRAGGRRSYRGKVKLHGTNAAVRCVDGRVSAQSRSKIITPDDDNYGFARWVEANKEVFCGEHHINGTGGTVFGEWVGPGIQSGVACSKIPRKVFVVFAVEYKGFVIRSPSVLRMLLPDHKDIFVLPWATEEFEIDFFGVNTQTIEMINSQVEAVEKICPWSRDTFGIEGVGEGLVYYPVDGILSLDHTSPDYFGHHVFKAKGEAHRANRSKDAAGMGDGTPDGVNDFVHLAVTEARLNQALEQVFGADIPSMSRTKDFLSWVQCDIVKELQPEILALDIEQRKLLGACGARAVQWLKSRC